jgi:phenylalanine-4-hydroxylase
VGSRKLPARGSFTFTLDSGVEVSGFVVEGHEVIDFHAWYAGKPLPLPTWAHVVVAAAIPSVAGGPADPATWDEYFGELDSFTAGASEAEARAHKASELSHVLTQAYLEVAGMRTARTADVAKLKALRQAHATEKLLIEQIDELLA